MTMREQIYRMLHPPLRHDAASDDPAKVRYLNEIARQRKREKLAREWDRLPTGGTRRVVQ